MTTLALQSWKEIQADIIKTIPKLFIVTAQPRTPRGTYGRRPNGGGGEKTYIGKPGKSRKKRGERYAYTRQCLRCNRTMYTDSPYIRQCKPCKDWQERFGGY